MQKLFYIYVLIVVLLTGACKKSDTTQPAATPASVNTAVTISSPPQVTGTLDGAAYSKVEDQVNITDGYSSDKNLATFPDTSTGIYSSYITNVTFTTTYVNVEKGTMRFMGSSAADTSFKAFYKPGSYPFSPGAVNGVVIIYFDGSGNAWSTDQGSKDQTGSSFVITDIQDGNILSNYVVKIKATFNCKLYNSSGQSKTFTNGIYIGNFANI